MKQTLLTILFALCLPLGGWGGQTAQADIVTGTLLGDATNGYYVNMPTSNTAATAPTIDLQTLIDNGVTRLTVYDDGGKDGNYDTQCNGRLILHAPSGYKLRFSGTITSENGSHSDDLTVYNGTTTSGTFVFPSLWSTINGEPTPFGPYISSGNEVLVTFYSYSSPAYAGFEMTVDLVDATQTFAITKATATGGSIETTVGGSPVTQITMDQTVTVTASPESGYWLSDISVGIDGSTVTVPALGGDFISNAATFTMPAAAVTVTPTFTDNPADLCVKMPVSGSWTRQIPTGITSFKVYDDGGATGNYSKKCNGSLILTAPENCVLMLTGSIATDMGDNFYVFNGTSVLTYKDAINTVRRSTTDGEAIDIGTLISTGRSLTLQFKSSAITTRAGLDLTATVIDATHAYAITIDPNLANGSIAPEVGGSAVNSATVNQTVTLTVTPANSFTTTEVSYTVGGTKHVIEPDNGTYSFTMPPADVTVSAVFMDELMTHWGFGNDGSEQHPYVISDKAGWDLLVEKSTFSDGFIYGKYFELSADISGVTAGLKNFTGHLDGNHHKITFADVAGGIITHGVINATFSNLSMEGSVDHAYVFEAAPRLTNCFVNVSRTGIGGFTRLSYNFNGSTNCAYLLEGLPASFAFGEDVIQPTGTYEVVLNGGATAVRTGGIAIGNGTATLYADGFSYGGTEYFKKDATVTLGADLPSGYSLTGYTVTGPTPSEDNTFSMPSHGVTVTAHSARTDYVTHWQASMAIDGTTADKAYVITTTDGLNLLATEVNGGNKFPDTFFRLDDDITYSHETAWNDDNSTENNFNGIGGGKKVGSLTKLYSFQGTFDGGGHTISGIRIYKYGQSYDTWYASLFGYVNDGGTVKNIVLADARFTGFNYVGGIVGSNKGTVSGCTAKSDVTVFAILDGSNGHGGIVGDNDGTVSGCTSSAHVTAKGDVADISDFGGIVGYNNGTILNCTAAGVVIGDVTDAGAIVGVNHGTLSGNTYHSSLVGTNAFNIGVGKYAEGTTNYTGTTLDESQLWLFDNRDNTAIIAAYTNPSQHVALHGYYPDANKSYTVTLEGRTLYKDGDWNTLCLPFNMIASQVTAQLAPAALMTLSTSSFADGTLTLNFADATTIEAGKPYIIKWTKPAGYDQASVDSRDIKNPVFTGVTIKSGTTNTQTEYVTFRGTFAPISYASANHNILFLGAGNTLYYPEAGAHIGAFRAYFELGNGLTAGTPSSPVRAFNLSFSGSADGSSASGIAVVPPANDADGDVRTPGWYTLDGVRLNGKPTKKGLYIHGGRKVVIP